VLNLGRAAYDFTGLPVVSFFFTQFQFVTIS
jgi:hypothetical protein